MADIEHKDIVDAQRHEPKGASTATLNHVLTSNGNGTTTFKDPTTLVDVGNVKTETVLNAFSVASSQQPAGTDLPIQIEFGAAQGTGVDPVMINSGGTITFNEIGNYRLRVILQYGRTGSVSQANLHARALAGGVQLGNTISASVDTAGILIASSIESWVNIPAPGTTLVYQLVRDSSGADAGGLFSSTVSVGWNFSPSASIVIDRIVEA